MVSHELRTPLAAVLGFTALLLERDFPPDEQRRYLEIIDAQARRLASLAGDFLDVELLAGGDLTIVRTPFDLVRARARADGAVLPAAGRAIACRSRLPGEPLVVDGDRDRLSQVVGNLLSNAIKYSPPEGEVRVSVRAEGPERGRRRLGRRHRHQPGGRGARVREVLPRSRTRPRRWAAPGSGSRSRGTSSPPTRARSRSSRPRAQGSTFVVRLPLGVQQPATEASARRSVELERLRCRRLQPLTAPPDTDVRDLDGSPESTRPLPRRESGGVGEGRLTEPGFSRAASSGREPQPRTHAPVGRDRFFGLYDPELPSRGDRTRTCNPRFWRPVRYQLRHAPRLAAPIVSAASAVASARAPGRAFHADHRGVRRDRGLQRDGVAVADRRRLGRSRGLDGVACLLGTKENAVLARILK